MEFYGDTSFIDNMARQSGGAISCNMNSEISFKGDTVFQKNHADSFGGAIYNLIIYNGTNTSKFQSDRNFADYGGAIAMIGTTKLIINPQAEIIFTENTAQYYGGAIFVDVYTSSECSIATADARPECFIMLDACPYSLFFNSSPQILNFTNNNAQNYGICCMEDH